MRRPVKNRNMVEPDEVYGSLKVSKLINYVMECGKKDTARKVVYKALEDLKKDGDPMLIFEEALEKASPSVEVRSRRVGGANYQVPREVRPERRTALAIRWLITYSRARGEKSMAGRLAAELLAASNNEGTTVKKRDDTHRMAEANKAFAHFRF